MTSTEVVALAASLYRRGWMPGTAGNISVRDPEHDDQALITRSGRSKGELDDRDVIAVSVLDSTSRTPGAGRPSAETTIHTAIYRATGSGAVVHVHSPHTTAVSVRYGSPDSTSSVLFEDYELLKGFGLADPRRCAVPVFANWPDVPRIGRAVEAYLTGTTDAPPVLLIAAHGVTSWGRDLAQARDRLECLEALCELVTLTGRPRPWHLRTGQE